MKAVLRDAGELSARQVWDDSERRRSVLGCGKTVRSSYVNFCRVIKILYTTEALRELASFKTHSTVFVERAQS